MPVTSFTVGVTISGVSTKLAHVSRAVSGTCPAGGGVGSVGSNGSVTCNHNSVLPGFTNLTLGGITVGAHSCAKTDNVGWGAGFKKCLADDVELINLSRGGRSSSTGSASSCRDSSPIRSSAAPASGSRAAPRERPAPRRAPVAYLKEMERMYLTVEGQKLGILECFEKAFERLNVPAVLAAPQSSPSPAPSPGNQ